MIPLTNHDLPRFIDHSKFPKPKFPSQGGTQNQNFHRSSAAYRLYLSTADPGRWPRSQGNRWPRYVKTAEGWYQNIMEMVEKLEVFLLIFWLISLIFVGAKIAGG